MAKETCLTLFDAFPVMGFSAGITFGLVVGSRFGIPTPVVVCAAVGGFVGLCVGLLPVFLISTWIRWSLRRKSIAELRTQLNQEDYYWISLEMIEELLARGEPVESLRESVAAQLKSSLAYVQVTGQRNATKWFPELLANSDKNKTLPPTS